MVDGQRFAAVAVAATEESDAFSFAIIDQRGQPAVPFMVEGRMFDVDDPHEGVVNEAGAAAFGVGVGDTLEVRTVGWDQRDEYIDDSGVGLELSGPRISVTVTGITRNAVDIAQQDDPFLTLGPAFVERYGDEVIHCPCIDMFDVEQGHEKEAASSIGRVYRDDEYVVDFEEGGDLPEHVANGIDVEVAAMQLLAVAAGLAGLIVVAQAIARQAAGSAGERATTSALGATAGQQTMTGVLEVAPAIVAGAFGSVVLAVGLSTLTPRGLARQAEIDPGLRIDGVVLAAGATAVAAIGIVLTFLAVRRSVRPVSPDSPRFVGLPGGVGAAGMLGIALATRPGGAVGAPPVAPWWRRRWVSPACSGSGRSRRAGSTCRPRAGCSVSTPIWRGAAIPTSSITSSMSLDRPSGVDAVGRALGARQRGDAHERRRIDDVATRARSTPSPAGPGRRSSAAGQQPGPTRWRSAARASTSWASTSATRSRSPATEKVVPSSPWSARWWRGGRTRSTPASRCRWTDCRH